MSLTFKGKYPITQKAYLYKLYISGPVNLWHLHKLVHYNITLEINTHLSDMFVQNSKALSLGVDFLFIYFSKTCYIYVYGFCIALVNIFNCGFTEYIKTTHSLHFIH